MEPNYSGRMEVLTNYRGRMGFNIHSGRMEDFATSKLMLANVSLFCLITEDEVQ